MISVVLGDIRGAGLYQGCWVISGVLGDIRGAG